MEDQPQSLEHHIQELRTRLLHTAIVFSILTATGFTISDRILAWLQTNLTVKLHALAAYETIYTQIMIALIFGFVTCLPVLVYQGLRFSKPGLKSGEYRLLRNFLPFSFFLFLLGAVFSYEFVVKTSFRFFESTTRAAEVAAVWGLQNTVGFALKLSILSGILFQLPVVCLVLAKAGLLTAAQMVQYRIYFIVAVLVLAAVATPPDIITQILVTVPVIGLYQISILLIKRIE
jgi:sec-independent protein translocase protein TatC